jgi:hypothetical protein
MRQFLFRSYNLIAESDDADLISDVCLDMHKAEVKLRQLREALRQRGKIQRAHRNAH